MHIADGEISTEGTSNQDSLKPETCSVPSARIPNSGLTQNMDRCTKPLPRNEADGNKPISVVPGCCPEPTIRYLPLRHALGSQIPRDALAFTRSKTSHQWFRDRGSCAGKRKIYCEILKRYCLEMQPLCSNSLRLTDTSSKYDQPLKEARGANMKVSAGVKHSVPLEQLVKLVQLVQQFLAKRQLAVLCEVAHNHLAISCDPQVPLVQCCCSLGGKANMVGGKALHLKKALTSSRELHVNINKRSMKFSELCIQVLCNGHRRHDVSSYLLKQAQSTTVDRRAQLRRLDSQSALQQATREVNLITPQLRVLTQQLRVEMRSNNLYYAQAVAIQNGSLLMSAFTSDIPHCIKALEKHGETKLEQCKQTVRASYILPLKEISNRSDIDGRGIMACWKYYIMVFSYLYYTQM